MEEIIISGNNRKDSEADGLVDEHRKRQKRVGRLGLYMGKGMEES